MQKLDDLSLAVSQDDRDEPHPGGRCGHGEKFEGDAIREVAAGYCL